ncbi:MAG: phosphotransferase [Chloroflexi bacterium]|nr:phosphotransferase [Chloroflexota bacterium]
MNLPPTFITTIQNTFGDEGRLWLDRLPALVSEASRRWQLTNVRPVPNLSYNFVAFAHRPSTLPKGGPALGEDIVLKIGVPNRELTSEMTALRLFDGHSAVRLLEADEQQFMFLLERLRPGEMLSTLEDDDQATNIAADVMPNLWQPAPIDARLIQLADWFAGLDKLRPAFNGGTGPFPKQLIEEVEELLPRLFSESSPPMLIHGDFHHFNILSSERGWIAIDPKGVIGPPEYEIGPLLINPWGDLQKISQLTKRRIAILSERLGFSRQMIRDWALCHAVLSAWWSIQDHESGEFAIKCAEILSEIKF